MSSGARHYVSKKQRACDACRIRKRACRSDIGAPCDFCYNLGRQCVFTDSTNRRKPKPSSVQESSTNARPQLRSTESIQSVALGEAMQSPIDVSDRQLAPDTVGNNDLHSFDAGLQDFAFATFDSHLFFGLSNDHPDERYEYGDILGSENSSPLDSRVPPVEVENASVNTPHIALDSDTTSTSQFIGHSSDMDPQLLQMYQYDQKEQLRFKKLTIQSLDQGKLPIQFLLSDQMSSVEDHLIKDLESIVSPQNGERMIALYQKYVSSQYPIFDEPPLAKQAPSYLLAAIYLSIRGYIPFDEQLCIELAYEGLPHQKLFEIFYRSLGPATAYPSIATVQALFLIVVGPGDPLIFEGPSRWTMFGTLVSCAQTVGLHLDPVSWNLAPTRITHRQILSALIYSTDKFLAASFGKPPLIRSDNWLITSLGRDARSAPFPAKIVGPGLVLHVEASNLLDRTLNELYSLKAISQLVTNTWYTLETARPLLEELKAWHRSFTNNCTDHTLSHTMSDSEASYVVGPTDTNVYELGYHFIRILILRAIVRPFIDQPVNVATPQGEDSLPRAEAYDNARVGIRACTTDAVKFVRSLTQEGTADTFWPPWASGVFSSLCYLLLLMFTTAHDYNDAKEWLRDLQVLRAELRLKSAGLPVLRLGLLRVDSIFWKDVSKVLKLPDHARMALRDVVNAARDGSR